MLLIGRLIIFIVWAVAIAWAIYSLYRFVKKTLRLMDLEREQAAMKIQSVQRGRAARAKLSSRLSRKQTMMLRNDDDEAHPAAGAGP